MTDIRTDQATDDLEEFCTICKREIRYESPENFDPVCMDDEGEVHCEECCLCSLGEEEMKLASNKRGESNE